MEYSRKEQGLFWNTSELSLTYEVSYPDLSACCSLSIQTPHFPPDSDLLLKAARTYHRFLTWPVPYCSICQELLTFIDAELKAPGKCRGGRCMGSSLCTQHQMAERREHKTQLKEEFLGEAEQGSRQGDPTTWSVPVPWFAKRSLRLPRSEREAPTIVTKGLSGFFLP